MLLYSHGYVEAGGPNPPQVAGSSLRRTGWAMEEAVRDQVELLDRFEKLLGHPDRTIAWGSSLGGLVTAALVEKFPERLDGALPICGVLAGSVCFWNVGLDMVFALKTLLAPSSDLELVDIANPARNRTRVGSILGAAQGTLQGRARVSLVAALGDIPGGSTGRGRARRERVRHPAGQPVSLDALGPAFNVVELGPDRPPLPSFPAFYIPEPSVFLRPFDSGSQS